MENLNNKYFIDDKRYNCPFCNTRSVEYRLVSRSVIDWSNDRKVYVYLIRCSGCRKISHHLSDFNFPTYNYQQDYDLFGNAPTNAEFEEGQDYSADKLDDYFFAHQPTSFFTVDLRIPKVLRNLISEADGCLKMNYLVGASGALRKAIYELLKDQDASGDSYQEKIKNLKVKYHNIYEGYFDALSNVQDMTSDNLHEKEGSWESWDNAELKYLLEVVKVVFNEIYVLPDEKKGILDKVTKLKSKASH